MSALELPCGVLLLNKFTEDVTMLVLDLLFVFSDLCRSNPTKIPTTKVEEHESIEAVTSNDLKSSIAVSDSKAVGHPTTV
ncbi:unnamed protein product [Arabidopsis thaliana]|uniref:(thale cress) hypothetical protein n=1 Tax=Arabidopsis thaliana TaxID=3702 RepID=A0A7G2EC17_ARATH|nr:unnamed protein product [Arabidopsis thaliana]